MIKFKARRVHRTGLWRVVVLNVGNWSNAFGLAGVEAVLKKYFAMVGAVKMCRIGRRG